MHELTVCRSEKCSGCCTSCENLGYHNCGFMITFLGTVMSLCLNNACFMCDLKSIDSTGMRCLGVCVLGGGGVLDDILDTYTKLGCHVYVLQSNILYTETKKILF